MDRRRQGSGEIAIILSISESTVNFHHKNIRRSSTRRTRRWLPPAPRRWASSEAQGRRPGAPTRSGRLPLPFILL